LSYLKLKNIKNTQEYDFKHSDESFFGPLSDINIFVGGNNAGKSRLLRELFSQTQDLNVEDDAISEFIELTTTINRFTESFSNYYVDFSFHIRNNIKESDPYFEFYTLLENKNQQSWNFNNQYLNTIKKNIEDLVDGKIQNEEIKNIFENFYIIFKLIIDKIFFNNYDFISIERRSFNSSADTKNQVESIFQIAKKLYNSKIELQNKDKIYIPNLRTVVSLFDENKSRYEKDIFLSSIRVNYGFEEDKKKKIFTGLSFYSEILSTKGSYKDDREQFQEFENFLSETFFNNQNIEITAISASRNDSEKVITITFDKSQERAVHLLGDGIHNLILLVFQFFVCKNGTKIYIEEPETNLHPGLERVFVNLLLENKFIKNKKLQVFFTTHSTHIINLDTFKSPNASIFYFQKRVEDQKEEFSIRNVVNPDIDILNGLGVKNSSLFMSNVSIWVEGITDRNYIKGMLEAYYESNEFIKAKKKKYLEDLNFGFFEYAGSNISHYIFNSELDILKEADGKRKLSKIKAQFLANRIFLIADKDKGKSSKHSSLGSFVSDNFEYYRTPGREIENLLSESLFRKIMPKIFKNIQASDLNNIDYKKYKDQYLGAYFRKVLKDKIPSTFKAKSGTISTYYKTRLSEEVYKTIIWDDMHSSMKRLTKDIYGFIEKHNSDNSF